MKPPRWVKMSGSYIRDGQLFVDVRIARWYLPVLYLRAVGHFRRQERIAPWWLPALYVWALAILVRKTGPFRRQRKSDRER